MCYRCFRSPALALSNERDLGSVDRTHACLGQSCVILHPHLFVSSFLTSICVGIDGSVPGRLPIRARISLSFALASHIVLKFAYESASCAARLPAHQICPCQREVMRNSRGKTAAARCMEKLGWLRPMKLTWTRRS